MISKFSFNLFNSFDHITDLFDDLATFLCSLLVIELKIGKLSLNPGGKSVKFYYLTNFIIKNLFKTIIN